MAEFSYKARDPKSNKIQKGIIDAPAIVDARQRIKEKNWLLLELKEHAVVAEASKRVRFGLKDKIVFTEQLAVMLRAGLPLAKALDSLVAEIENPRQKAMIGQLVGDVEGGMSFADALEKYHRVFGTVYIQMIRAGEKTGSLDKVMDRLTVQLQKDYDISSKVKSALIYPAIISVIMLVVVIVIIVFVIPHLGQVFIDAGVPLPPATRLLLGISAFSVKYGVWILAAFIAFVVAIKVTFSRPKPATAWDRFKLHIPVYGPFVRKVIMARFSLGFASLLAAGLPVLDIFETLGELVDNLAYREEIRRIAKDVENGKSISESLHTSFYFPSMVSQLTSIGEKSGSLDEIFWVINSFYDKEVDAMTRNLSASLEPIIMVVLGLAISFIMVSVLQPMYGMVNVI